MKLKLFLVINAVLFVPFSTAMLLIPKLLFSIFGIDLDADGILMARVFAAALFNFGLICYLIRSENIFGAGIRAILIGNFIFHALDAVSTGVASYTGVMNSLGWMFFGLHLVLAIGFLYFLTNRGNTALKSKN